MILKSALKFILFVLLGCSAAKAAPSPISDWSDEILFGQVGFEKLEVKDIIIGIEPYEREMLQNLIIDMKVTVDLQKVIQSDDLSSTVDYVKLAEIAEYEAREGKHLLIDVLGMKILQDVFLTYPDVQQAFIRIQKPAALPKAESGGLIEISSSRDEILDPKGKVMGKIGFNQLLVHTIIGDLPEERENEQDLLVDLRVSLDFQAVNKSKEIEVTANYVEMAKMLESASHTGKYYMFETLAVNYLKDLFKKYPRIEEACVRICKPGTLPTYPFKNDAITEVRLVNKKGMNQ